MSDSSGFERKTLSDGSINSKYVDVLEEDAGIAGQKFTCMSFLSPEKILDNLEQFLFDCFVEQWDFTKSMTKFGDFINFISYKYNLNVETLMADYNDFCKEEQQRLKENGVSDDYKNFLDKNDIINYEFREKPFYINSENKINYIFNSTINGIEDSDCIVLIDVFD